MTQYLYIHQIRIFDYPGWANALREKPRSNAETLAIEHGVQIEFVRRAHLRNEARIAEVIKTRGDHPGLAHILSELDDPPAGQRDLKKLSEPKEEYGRTYTDFNFFSAPDSLLPHQPGTSCGPDGLKLKEFFPQTHAFRPRFVTAAVGRMKWAARPLDLRSGSSTLDPF